MFYFRPNYCFLFHEGRKLGQGGANKEKREGTKKLEASIKSKHRYNGGKEMKKKRKERFIWHPKEVPGSKHWKR